MGWWEWAVIACLLVGIVGMGAILTVRLYNNPFLLAGLIPTIWAHVKPVLLRVIFDRMEPELEEEMRKCIKRGGKWDNFRKKCVDRN